LNIEQYGIILFYLNSAVSCFVCFICSVQVCWLHTLWTCGSKTSVWWLYINGCYVQSHRRRSTALARSILFRVGCTFHAVIFVKFLNISKLICTQDDHSFGKIWKFRNLTRCLAVAEGPHISGTLHWSLSK